MATFAGRVFFRFGQRAALAAVEDERFAVVGQHGLGARARAQGEDEGVVLRVGEVELVVDAVVRAFAAQAVKRGQRALAQLAVFYGQHARQGEAMRPAVARAGAGGVGQSHPADEQALAVRAEGALRCVVVKTVVEFAEAVVVKAAGGFVKRAEEVAGLVNVAVAVAVGRQALRAAEEDVAPGEREVVRAFPHVAETGQGEVDFAAQLPGLGVGGGEVEGGAAFVVALRAEDDAVTAIRLAPDFRVAHVFAVACGRAFEEGFVFVQSVRIKAGSELVGDAFPGGGAVVAGVGDEQTVAVGERAAGVGAVAVPFSIRCDADAARLVVHKVGAGQVLPVFEAVYRAERKPLVKEMIFAPVVAETVGVIQKPGRRLHVVALSPRASGGLRTEGFVTFAAVGIECGVTRFAGPMSIHAGRSGFWWHSA